MKRGARFSVSGVKNLKCKVNAFLRKNGEKKPQIYKSGIIFPGQKTSSLIYSSILSAFTANSVYMTDMPPPYPGINGYTGYNVSYANMASAPPPPAGFAVPPQAQNGKAGPFVFGDFG